METVTKWLKKESTKQGIAAILLSVVAWLNHKIGIDSMAYAVIGSIAFMLYPTDKTMENNVDTLGKSILNVIESVETMKAALPAVTAPNATTKDATK